MSSKGSKGGAKRPRSGAAGGAKGQGGVKSGPKAGAGGASSAATDADTRECQPFVTATAVLPGQDVTALTVGATESETTRIGAGLVEEDGAVVVTVPGKIASKEPNRFWVESSGRRYAPAVDDTVIGIVSGRSADAYRLDISGTSPALLPSLAFDGASKRNKPNFEVGTLVYARVAAYDKDLEPELSCKVTSGVKKDWVTGQSVFGELKGGNVIECSMALARRLLSPSCPVLQALGASLPFELAVGMNGRVWVNSGSVAHTILICNAISRSEYLTAAETRKLVRTLLTRVSRT